MSRKVWLALVMVLSLSFPALAQTITVTGTVVDPTGEPLIGASVLVQGESLGTATDFDGVYSIKAPADGTLTISYVGYTTQEIAINGRTTIDVTMEENSVVLGEVVAIGYGTVKKSDATGSVAVIKPDEVEMGLAKSAQDLLVGASPGVVVTTQGGDPTGNATIRIRGGSSLNASNDPLIVIDGVPMTNQSNAGGTNALTMVNPQNIESMTILKDASATAIYGSRASNGVIIITTKKGQSGRPQVNFSANFHLATARKTFDMMNASEFRNVMTNVVKSETGIGRLGDSNTNWQKEILRTAFSHDYNLSVGGTAGFLPYRVSASYTDNSGVIKTSEMQRTTVGINLSPKFFNGKLQVNANVLGTYINSRTGDTGTLGAAITSDPTQPVRTAYPTTGNTGMTMFNGYTNTFDNLSGMPTLSASENPVQRLMDTDARNKVYSSSGNLQIDYALHFLPELHFNLNLGYQVSKNESNTTTAANSIMTWRNDGLSTYGAPGASTLYKWYEVQRNTLLDFYVNYRKEFTEIKSNLDVMAGYSWQRFSYFGHSNTYVNSLGINRTYDAATGTFNLNWDESSKGLINTPVNNNEMSRWSAPLQLVSFFGRLNYTFDDTYLLTFTLRDDATSRFSKDNRWGLFPSLALGWKIINMPVMEPVRDYWDELKLRLGWGVTGQQDVSGYFPYLPIYVQASGLGHMYLNPSGDGWIQPIYPQAYTSNIKWEETTTWNIGLDAGWLNNRITASLDWYLRDTKDLLSSTRVPGFNTSDVQLANIGTLRNVGFEVNITARPIQTRDFTWTTGFNYSYNQNKITSLAEGNTMIEAGVSTPAGTGGDIAYHIVGKPAFTYRVFEQVYNSNGDPIPGQYVDQNADGVINTDDLIEFHSPEPKATFTWNNTFNYKGWDLGFVLRANLGNYAYNNAEYAYGRLFNASGNYQNNNLMNGIFLWSQPGTKADENLSHSSYFIQNASFIRCDNITLGYTFENLFHDKLRLRLFGAVQNPFVITKYRGLDPEIPTEKRGIDNDVYPRPITCTFGLVATF
ncbi:MAG: TonB-dependent receptor [Lachnoclostridium sp.]|nr:TonB-dependent receptor [Lachnoclostridium sp.]